MTINQWLTYCLAVFAGGIIPGPIMLLAMTAGAKRGVASALPAAIGNVLASVLQVWVSIAHIGLIAQNIDSLFRVMMVVGGAYLIYLGLTLLRANPFKLASGGIESPSNNGTKDFIDVFLITLLNPKAIMFFVALFPQVIPRDHYSLSLVVGMTVAFAVIALLCFVIYAAFGTGIKRMAGRGLFADIINFTLSAVFVVMGGYAIFNAVQT